ncbi:MAG TPA: tetratricopeptide repeat protein [Deltaproteobacteria bacterium]|nr:tetratricopeptide repeat protein [Deltaproteobacteria bacterium]
MDYRRILDRIRSTIRVGSYLVPPSSVPAAQREALSGVAAAIADPDNDPEQIRLRILQLYAAGRIDRVMKLSALGVLAASPNVRDYAEAARLAGQQEMVALDEGGPHRDAYLASADRHRGVLAYLLGRYEVALDWFTRALERERTSENLGNVLSTLIRLGELDEARTLLDQACTSAPDTVRLELLSRIEIDDDLSRLRPRS